MPASLYRMVGRPHHTEAPQAQFEQPAIQAATPEIVSEPALAQHEPAETLESFASQVEEPAADVVKEVQEVAHVVETVNDETLPTVNEPEPEVQDSVVPTPEIPSWEPTWSKTQLLAVATQLGLAVTSSSTKNEIIAALTAASSS